jgi:bifunctional non-homologous end joining protein LigD
MEGRVAIMGRFIKPMECLPAETLPSGPNWTFEIKLDGYRIEAVREARGVILYSRLGNRRDQDFPSIAAALEHLPAGTIVDGELAALDSHGCPRFTLLQNFRRERVRLVYFVFDILAHEGRELTGTPLSERRSLLRSVVQTSDCVAISEFTTSAGAMLRFVKEQKLEGIIAKRADSRYEPGRRSGVWVKTRVQLSQEFVVGGYTPSHLGIDALIVGFYNGKKLLYAGRVRAGFNPRSRRTVFEKIRHLETEKCPFANLPDASPGPWGQGLTAEKMKQCHWLRPEAVAQIEFGEWTSNDRLRHASFVTLRDDKEARSVVKER